MSADAKFQMKNLYTSNKLFFLPLTGMVSAIIVLAISPINAEARQKKPITKTTGPKATLKYRSIKPLSNCTIEETENGQLGFFIGTNFQWIASSAPRNIVSREEPPRVSKSASISASSSLGKGAWKLRFDRPVFTSNGGTNVGFVSTKVTSNGVGTWQDNKIVSAIPQVKRNKVKKYNVNVAGRAKNFKERTYRAKIVVTCLATGVGAS